MLQIGRYFLPDIRHCCIERNHQLPGRFNRFPIHHGGHGQTILTTVYTNADGNHCLAHPFHRFPNRYSLSRKLRRPHPVSRTFDLLKVFHNHGSQVGHRLANRHAGSSSRINQHFDRLLTNGRSDAGKTKMALGDNSRIGNGKLQRTTTLLLGYESSNSPVHLVG